MSQPSTNVGTNQSGSTLPGLFKQVYSKEVQDAIPDFALMQKLVPFTKAKLLGDAFNIPVVLADEQGFSYGGSSGANYNLNSAIAMQLQNAQVRGSELTLQSGISYGAVSRAQAAGDTAVESAVRLLIERMKASSAKRVEIAMLYGQSPTGIGVISATSGTGTTRTYTISTATYAAGIWAGLENSQIDCYSAAGSQLNTNAPIVITAVSVANQTVTVSGNSTDLSAIDTSLSGSGNPTFYFYGAYGNEMVGIDAISLNTGSLFGINAGTYNLWAANTYSCSNAALNMGKILSGLALAVARGLHEDVVLLCNPSSFADIVSDLAAQRRFDGSYKSKKLENGAEGVVFYGQSGMITVTPHPMVKNGDAFALSLDDLQRVGSTDITFKGQMTGGEEEYLFQSPTANSWLTRTYTDQAIIHVAPAKMVKFTGIVA